MVTAQRAYETALGLIPGSDRKNAAQVRAALAALERAAESHCGAHTAALGVRSERAGVDGGAEAACERAARCEAGAEPDGAEAGAHRAPEEVRHRTVRVRLKTGQRSTALELRVSPAPPRPERARQRACERARG
jgi:hypothetical protein